MTGLLATTGLRRPLVLDDCVQLPLILDHAVLLLLDPDIVVRAQPFDAIEIELASLSRH